MYKYIYSHIFTYKYYHQVMLLTGIPPHSLSLFIRPYHPMSVECCCPCEGVQKRMSFLLLKQCPAFLVHLIWTVLEMGRKSPYSCCFVGRCFQHLFNIARNIFVQFPSGFFSIRFVSIHMAHSSSNIDTTATWKNFSFNLIG